MRFVHGVSKLFPPHGRAVPMLLAALLSTGVTNGLDRTRQGTAAAAEPLPPIVLQAPSGPVDPAPLEQTWVATSLTIQRLDVLDGATVARFFGPTFFGLGGWGGSVPALSWASEAAFASDLASGRVPDGVRAVMYDPESWSATPVSEQRDPEAAMRAFAALARRHGYVVVITPHPGLVLAPGAACAAQPGETDQAAFLRCDLEGRRPRVAIGSLQTVIASSTSAPLVADEGHLPLVETS